MYLIQKLVFESYSDSELIDIVNGKYLDGTSKDAMRELNRRTHKNKISDLLGRSDQA